MICCLSLLSVFESEHLLLSWFTLASKPCVISLIPWPPDNHWQWVPWVNRWLCSFGRADLSLFPFPLQTTSLTFLPRMGKGQRLPSNGLWYFMCFQDYSCGWEAPSAHCFVLGLEPLRKQDDVNGRHVGIFYSARKKTKNKHWDKRYKNTVGVVLNCLLPSFPLCSPWTERCVMGIWFLPGLSTP